MVQRADKDWRQLPWHPLKTYFFIFFHKEKVCLKYLANIQERCPISHGYMYLFILVKYLVRAIVELTLCTVLTECRAVWEMYVLKTDMHQFVCMHLSFHLSINLCVHPSIQVLKSYVTCLSAQLSFSPDIKLRSKLKRDVANCKLIYFDWMVCLPRGNKGILTEQRGS